MTKLPKLNKKNKKIEITPLTPPNTLGHIPVINGQSPPPNYDDGQDKPLASIPLSQLMKMNDMVCPVCGKSLPIDMKEVILDGQVYYACKVCIK